MSVKAIGASNSGVTSCDTQPGKPSLTYRIYEGLKIVFTDLLPANITCILPNALSWGYRTLWAKSVQSYTLSVSTGTTTKTAHLFAHSLEDLERPNVPISAILLLHGDHSHPLTMLHLADIAKAQGKTVFSVHLPYEDGNPASHRSLLKKSINKIDQIISKNGGKLSHLLLSGHSRGAMEAANEAFVENNPKVNGVISIAGRFKVIKPSSRPCRASLEPSIHALWEKLRMRNLRVPFYQIAAKNDWCMDPEASIVRRDHSHLYVDASHLGVINHPETLKQFKAWTSL